MSLPQTLAPNLAPKRRAEFTGLEYGKFAPIGEIGPCGKFDKLSSV
jgi:hypothetical protein